MTARGYNRFDFALDGKRGYLVDEKFPPEERCGFDPYEYGTSCRNDFYYLTERGHEYGDYYRLDDMDDPQDKGRELYRAEPCDSDGHRSGWDAVILEAVKVKHGRSILHGFNRVELPEGEGDE